jgi:hypothetical protein
MGAWDLFLSSTSKQDARTMYADITGISGVAFPGFYSVWHLPSV